MTGFIVLNKPVGVGSTREVSAVKRLSHVPCGHMGTLDPLASGVLPVGVGNACRLFDYFLDKTKVYQAVFQFGKTSDTLDITGDVIDEGFVPTADQIREVLPRFVGTTSQMPPKYSAKKIDGKCGYQLARAGVDFELKPKDVRIDEIRLLDRVSEDGFSFSVTCGGGTYIRSLGRDIASALGTCAVMSALCRTQSGVFTLDQAVSSDRLTAENWQDYLIPTEDVLPLPSVHPKGWDAHRLFNGLAIQTDLQEGTYKIYDEQDVFYGLAVVQEGTLKIRTKLC